MKRLAGPLRDDEVDARLRSLVGHDAVVVAVSGGADSLALLHLVDRWSVRSIVRPSLLVMTVDHGLRPGSGAEAEMVAQVAAARGLHHETLAWEGPKPVTGIEAAARDARYRLLGAAARRAGARALLTAHHQDDQAETVLMRLGRGSGLAGLGGMAEQRSLTGDEVMLVRPFLDVPKARLVATAVAAGLTPAEDAMNTDPRFARARLRRLMPGLAAEGVDAAALGRAARLFRRAEEALAIVTRGWLQRNVVADPLGMARIPRSGLAAEPQEIRLRALGAMIAAVGGGSFPGDDGLAGLDEAVISTHPFRRTLGGAVIRSRGPDVVVHREAGRMDISDTPLPPGFSGSWDGRFAIAVGDAEGVSVGPLGARGYAELPRERRARPQAAAETVPAFRVDGLLVSVPAVGFGRPGSDGLRAAEFAAARLAGRSPEAVSSPTWKAGHLIRKQE